MLLTKEKNLGVMLTMLVREVAMIGKPVQPFGAMFYAALIRGMYIMLNNAFANAFAHDRAGARTAHPLRAVAYLA
jgi:hypothetical protein